MAFVHFDIVVDVAIVGEIDGDKAVVAVVVDGMLVAVDDDQDVVVGVATRRHLPNHRVVVAAEVEFGKTKKKRQRRQTKDHRKDWCETHCYHRRCCCSTTVDHHTHCCESL